MSNIGYRRVAYINANINPVNQTLGTQLRHLIDMLDGAVAAGYHDLGLSYRPRYTPIVRALMSLEPRTIRPNR
jgi:hypothetical protein